MLTDKQKKLIKNLENVKASAKTRTEYNAYQQMLTRIRKFGRNAIEDLLYLLDELPEDETDKIFADVKISTTLIKLEKYLDRILTSSTDIDAQERLRKKFGPPHKLEQEILKNKNKTLQLEYDKTKLLEFLEEKGLKQEYEHRKSQENSDEIREVLRTAGWTDEKINEVLEKRAQKS